jgi:hypothetical protein
MQARVDLRVDALEYADVCWYADVC